MSLARIGDPGARSAWPDRIRRGWSATATWGPAQALLRALSWWRPPPGPVWKRLPAADPARAPLPGGSVVLLRGPEHRRRHLQWLGLAAEEPESMPVWLALAASSEHVIDIGANLGVYALAACAVNPGCRVEAYEPVPELASFLRRSVSDNGWDDRCIVREVALCDQSGELAFNSTGALGFMSSLDPGGFRGKRGETILVAAETLDNQVHARPVDLVKIDVEGFEDRVLRGMSVVLQRERPTVMVECLPDGPYREVQELLEPFDYEFFHLTSRGPKRAREIVPDAHEQDRNYLACARNRAIRVVAAFAE